MSTVVIVGGGYAGCSAAATAAKAGAEVLLLEKSDMLTGLGVLTGVLGGQGGFTVREEMRAMGGADIFEAIESIVIHDIDYIELLNRRHIKVFNVLKLESAIRRVLDGAGVDIRLRARAKDVKMKGTRLTHIVLNDGSTIEGDVFVDATGGCGTVAECTKHGFGCVMCVMRCPTFGGRVSISAKAGVKDLTAVRPDGKLGAFSSAFMLVKDSLARHLVAEMESKGYIVVPLPKELVDYNKLEMITATENARPEFLENLFIFDNGFAKVMVQSYMPLDDLHSVPGFEYARMVDPISGGVGNAVRGLAMAPRENSLSVQGLDNLYCAGEKSGPMSGMPAVILTGVLAGHNAARRAFAKEDLVLPRSLSAGEFIAYEKEMMETPGALVRRYGFSGGHFFDRMKEQGLYSPDIEEIKARVEKTGLRDVFAQRVA